MNKRTIIFTGTNKKKKNIYTEIETGGLDYKIAIKSMCVMNNKTLIDIDKYSVRTKLYG